jgi:hypothetical protein
MFRKITLALAAASALCLGAISATPASAGWHGGHHHHWHGGWRGPAFYGIATYPAYTSCYRPVRVFTPWGPRWRRVWVCG